MKSLFAKVLGVMAVIAIVYCNYHAARETKPLFVRLRNKVTGSKTYRRVSGWVSRVTDSNIVQSARTKASNAKGRVVHMFKRREHVA